MAASIKRWNVKPKWKALNKAHSRRLTLRRYVVALWNRANLRWQCISNFGGPRAAGSGSTYISRYSKLRFPNLECNVCTPLQGHQTEPFGQGRSRATKYVHRARSSESKRTWWNPPVSSDQIYSLAYLSLFDPCFARAPGIRWVARTPGPVHSSAERLRCHSI